MGRRRLRTMAFVVAAVGLAVVGATFLLPAPTVSSRPVADPLARATVRLGSPDLDGRLAAIHELEGLMWRYESPHQPEVMTTLSAFVRERTGGGCGPAKPERDVDVAMSVLGHRSAARDEGTVMDLHGACLAGLVLTYINLAHANLSEADLSAATLAGMNLTGVELAGARLASANLGQADLRDADLSDADLTGADLTSARWSDGTIWPPEYEQTVAAASRADGDHFVIGALRL
jgi:Pentapeptide repeats (8 copies)